MFNNILIKIFRLVGRKFNFYVLLDYAYRFEIAKLKQQGVNVGENSLIIDCKFSNSQKGDKFTIGSHTTCTGVTFIGHDASPTVLIDRLVIKQKVYYPGSRLSYRKEIVIGDRCFIGVGSIILPGVSICDRTIIAAGAVVTKSIQDAGVYGGNPAKKIGDIEDYINKYNNLIDTSPEAF
ncbi:acyltransferase [Aeromonas sp. QDB66]|uniref:acyltransferase n=1 Tax=Aeromonas sp. QDB66 TaxID=2989824 RepID=UPI0022E7490C|nr:acyltransferase [Aeromonas sp. QDB66]